MRVTGSMLWGSSAPYLSTSFYGTGSKTAATRSAAKAAAIQKNGYNLPDSFYKMSTTAAESATQAQKLVSSAQAFSSSSRNGIFARAKQSGSNGELLVNARELVSSYNATRKNLRNTSGALNDYYNQSMQNAFSGQSEELSKIGITVNSDRSVTIDEAKFRSSDVADIEKALGPDSELTKSLSYNAQGASRSLANNASTAAAFSNALYGGYNSFGGYGLGSYGFGGNSYLSALMGSRYNFWF